MLRRIKFWVRSLVYIPYSPDFVLINQTKSPKTTHTNYFCEMYLSEKNGNLQQNMLQNQPSDPANKKECFNMYFKFDLSKKSIYDIYLCIRSELIAT